MYEFSSVFLEHEDWSEWFTLDFLLATKFAAPCLILGIAEDPLRRLVALLPKYRAIDFCKERLKEYDIEAEFLFDIDKPWGFAGVLEPYQRASRDDGQKFIKYAISIPQVEKDVGECGDCAGKGKDADGMECLHCMGKGRETTLEWEVIDCIAATLCVLEVILDKPDKELLVGIDTKRKQLLSVQTCFNRSSAYIGAVLSKPFGDYVRTLSEQELPEVKAAIKSVYLRMFPGYKQFAHFGFCAVVHANGQLIIDVPGDACGLYVDGMSTSLHEASGPMQLDCHNVDGHHQQLTLLCGLAALCGIARKNLSPNA